ncbi:hypothetical protein [Breznakia pachnodae]|uniref:Uncharacterized protein n=1 Tax=Breznakia pachnodae TaxID=265178 RepID=A0ABU0DZ44_9FIRM|nr:hypothetical protein [Breznakia pachnodae]MDQ0359898.1 hypothetical protein [Breznakia pachnodae]
MSELIIKDSELKQAEDFINQFMKELIGYCEEYYSNATVIHSEGLKNSEMIEVIKNKIAPLSSFYVVEKQVKVSGKSQGHESIKVTSGKSFLGKSVNDFISDIDEIDSILY